MNVGNNYAVIHCSTACLTALSGKFNPSRMPLLNFLLELDEGTTSRQFFVSCTGFLYRDMSTSSWHVSFTRLCPTSVLGWRHKLGFGRSKTSTPLVHRQILCCSTDAQHMTPAGIQNGVLSWCAI